MKTKVFIVVLLTSLSFNTFAEWIAIEAVLDTHQGIVDTRKSWSGRARVQTDISYSLGTNIGSEAVISIAGGAGFFDYCAGQEWKEGTRTVYPGDIVSLRAEVFGIGPGRIIANATIWVHVNGAFN